MTIEMKTYRRPDPLPAWPRTACRRAAHAGVGHADRLWSVPQWASVVHRVHDPSVAPAVVMQAGVIALLVAHWVSVVQAAHTCVVVLQIGEVGLPQCVSVLHATQDPAPAPRRDARGVVALLATHWVRRAGSAYVRRRVADGRGARAVGIGGALHAGPGARAGSGDANGVPWRSVLRTGCRSRRPCKAWVVVGLQMGVAAGATGIDEALHAGPRARRSSVMQTPAATPFRAAHWVSAVQAAQRESPCCISAVGPGQLVSLRHCTHDPAPPPFEQAQGLERALARALGSWCRPSRCGWSCCRSVSAPHRRVSLHTTHRPVAASQNGVAGVRK